MRPDSRIGDRARAASASPRCMTWVGSTKLCAASAASIVSDRLQDFVLDHRPGRGFPGQRHAGGGDGEHRLAVIFDQAVGENRIAHEGRTHIVDARNVAGGHHRGNAGRPDHRCQIHGYDPRVSDAGSVR